MICIVSGKSDTVYTVLAALRCELGKKLGLIDESRFAFLWITEFPLFEYSEEEQRYVAMHHPFTSPLPEDCDKIESDPGSARASAYDIVLNGYEIGGGSIRIHDRALPAEDVSSAGLYRRGCAGSFRIPAGCLSIRRAAARRPGIWPRPACHADLRNGQHQRYDCLPESTERFLSDVLGSRIM